ncbi:MAG: hypothetical protein CME59_19845 [Halioglobus sp.]|nr:hypothetical protein [Halioglobus sp.]|tara:strand:+ start:384 stop:824 length:441 start_codon:yes stop_codon:yes gene_type:complete
MSLIEQASELKWVRNRPLRFVLAGGISALCNFGSRFFYSLFMDFSVAVVCAFMTGMTVAFVLNKLFVFTTSRRRVGEEVIWFTVVNMFGLLQTWLISVYLNMGLQQLALFSGAQGIAWAEALAHGTGVAFPVFTSYLGHKYLTFRE